MQGSNRKISVPWAAITRIAIVSFLSFVFTISIADAVDTSPETATASVEDILTDTPSIKLSFDFQNIDIRSLLQLVAKNSGLNFMISDTVKGNVSLNLKHVTWQQALNIILKTQGLASRQIGNVLYISTIDEITNTEAKELKSEEVLTNMAPLKSALIRLNYTDAKAMADMIKGQQGTLLTGRGEIAIDTRTNSIIIRDVASNLTELTRSIKQLDIPTKQVLIEARIVNIDTTYEENLGVRFGVSDTRHLSGTLAGANQLTQYVGVNNITPLSDRLNFNVPANQLFDGTTPGSVALALARVGHLLLDLELSAMEGENHAQVISRPRVITSNQQKALIETGEEIPYQEATSSGATSVVFKKAVLSLEIIPQITPDNRIMLKMKATQDTVGQNIQVSNNASTPTTIPAINTQEVESNVLLNNEETIVVGGVYRVNKIKTIDRIPFFGSLPVVGHLFSSSGNHDEKHELLIFITPKIISNAPFKVASEKPKRHKMSKIAVYKEEM